MKRECIKREGQDDQFLTDQAAFDEAMRALDEEPLEFMEPLAGSSLN